MANIYVVQHAETEEMAAFHTREAAISFMWEQFEDRDLPVWSTTTHRYEPIQNFVPLEQCLNFLKKFSLWQLCDIFEGLCTIQEVKFFD